MDREEIIKHWMSIINCVFLAEHKIVDSWKEALEGAKMNKSKAPKVIKDYLYAIATEIVDSTPEEDLKKYYSK
jgi:hypothetical protein